MVKINKIREEQRGEAKKVEGKKKKNGNTDTTNNLSNQPLIT